MEIRHAESGNYLGKGWSKLHPPPSLLNLTKKESE